VAVKRFYPGFESAQPAPVTAGPLRIAFLGRLDVGGRGAAKRIYPGRLDQSRFVARPDLFAQCRSRERITIMGVVGATPRRDCILRKPPLKIHAISSGEA